MVIYFSKTGSHSVFSATSGAGNLLHSEVTQPNQTPVPSARLASRYALQLFTPNFSPITKSARCLCSASPCCIGGIIATDVTR